MGAGNSARRAQREAQRSEDDRRAQIANTTENINRIFDAPERQKQVGDYVNAIRTQYTDDANRQRAVADRNLRFSLARSGLAGGSADADARRGLGEEFARGTLQAEDKAQRAGADLRAQDEQQRNNLIGLAQSGLDATTAAQRANAAVADSAQRARSASIGDGLGDIFVNTAGLYKQQQEAAARRAGTLAPVGSLYGNPYRR